VWVVLAWPGIRVLGWSYLAGMTKVFFPLLLAVVVVLTGCGADPVDDSAASPSPAAVESGVVESESADPAASLVDAADVAERYGLVDEGDGWYIATVEGTECEVLLLTGAAEVATYVGAGDVVATNADSTVGLKITGDSKRTCFDGLTELLVTE